MEQDRLEIFSVQLGRRLKSWGCNVEKSGGPTVQESTALDEVCHRRVVKIAVPPSAPPLQSNDTRPRCYVCEEHTSSPIRLEAYGLARGPPCPHIACSLECHGQLNNLWLDLCQEFREMEDSLPRHRQSEVQQSRSPEVQEPMSPEGVSEADPSSWLIHPDIDEARVGVQAVERSILHIGEAIRNLNNLWWRLRDFEKKQSAVAGIIAGFLKLSPCNWLSESRRLTSHSIQHLESQELRLSGQLTLRLKHLADEEIRIKASRYDSSAGPSNSCSSKQEQRAT